MSAEILQQLLAVKMPAAALREVLAIIATIQPTGKPLSKSAERMRRHRERNSDVTCDALVTSPTVTCDAECDVTCDDSPSPPSSLSLSPLHPPLPLPPAPTPESEPAHTREEGSLFPKADKGKATLAEWLDHAATFDPAWPPLEAERAWSHYDGNGWRTGKNPVRKWKACCRTCYLGWRSESLPATKTKPIPRMEKVEFESIESDDLLRQEGLLT